jgi:hypothetical protein
MGALTTKLSVYRGAGADSSCRLISIQKYQNVYLFWAIYKKVMRKFAGKTEREIRKSINSQEMLIAVEIKGKKIDFSWDWSGIDISSYGPDAKMVLDEIADYIESIRFVSLWLWFMEKTGGGT